MMDRLKRKLIIKSFSVKKMGFMIFHASLPGIILRDSIYILNVL